MNGWRAWLCLEVWLAIAAWVMLFVAMGLKAAKAEREATPNRSPCARIWFN